MGFGVTNPMLAAVLIGQMAMFIKWLLTQIFNTHKKAEEKKAEQMQKLIDAVEKLQKDVQAINHTMLSESDVEKTVQLVVYRMSHEKGKTQ
jgi:Na+/phosphate symporter